MIELAVRLLVEMPPRSVLTRLATYAFPEACAVSVLENGFDNCLLLANKIYERRIHVRNLHDSYIVDFIYR